MPDQALVAFHEAGHAVVAHVLGLRIRGVTLTPPQADVIIPPSRRDDELVVLLAGDVAGERYAGRELLPHERSDDDRREALLLIAGLPERERAMALLAARDRAAAIIRRHWLAVEAIAGRLLRDGSLRGSDVQSLIEEGQTVLTRSWFEAFKVMDRDDQILALREQARRIYFARHGKSPETRGEEAEALDLLKAAVNQFLAAEERRKRGDASALDWVANPPKTKGEYRALVDRDEATWARGW